MPDDSQNTNVGGDGKNTGSGAEEKPGAASQTGGAAAGAGNGDQAAAGGGNTGGAANAGGDGSKEAEKKFTQADLDSIAAKVRDEEKRKSDGKLKAAADEVARKQAESQGEFQKLYEAEKVRAADLEQKAVKADAYATRINQVLDGEIKEWPAEVKKTDPGAEKLDDRLQWIETHRDLAKRLLAAGKAPNMEHGNQGRNIKPSDITDNYLKSQYSRPASASQ